MARQRHDARSNGLRGNSVAEEILARQQHDDAGRPPQRTLSSVSGPSRLARSRLDGEGGSASGTNARTRSPATDVATKRPRRARLSQGGAPESKGIPDDRDGAERHGGARDDRAQQHAEERVEHAGGDGHTEHVVDEGEEQVLPNVLHRQAAQTPCS